MVLQRLGNASRRNGKDSSEMQSKATALQSEAKAMYATNRAVLASQSTEEKKQMDDKNFKSVVVWFTAFMAVTAISGEISGKIGLLVWALGTALLLMWAYFEYRAEQAAERERKKVRMLTKKIKEAYTEEKENYFSQY